MKNIVFRIGSYYRNWFKDGTWNALYGRLRGQTRAAYDRSESPSEVILDSQSVPTAPMVHRSVGYYVAKATKGRKRHLVVDTLGLMMAVLVTAASVPEQADGQQALQKFYQLGETVARVYLVWVDGGYSGPNFLQWVMDTFGWIVHVVLRSQESKGFILLKKSWVVERTFGQWRWSRRLVQDYEQLHENTEAML